jgi:hypothetical protein
VAGSCLQPLQGCNLQGFKYLEFLRPLLSQLHDNATQRDRAGNRRLFFDQYACLLLLYFFNPVIKSLRGVQRASELEKTQSMLGCPRVSRGSLSEASSIFDPALLQAIIGELAHRAKPLAERRELEALRDLEAVDGSLFVALPKMAWALWKDDRHRAAKMHVHFHVLKAVPTSVTITAANDSERDQLQATLKPGGFYVFDRGFRGWAYFQRIVAAKASFVGRAQNNTVIHPVEERPLTAEARAAGIVRDVEIEEIGNQRHPMALKYPLRILVIDTGKRLFNGKPEFLILCTNRLDLPAELVALAYKFRWTIELFFRWFKCILACRHLLSTSLNGVTLQIYLGVIASLLISLWCGKKPTRATLEMLQFYFIGWATEEELRDHIARLKDNA